MRITTARPPLGDLTGLLEGVYPIGESMSTKSTMKISVPVLTERVKWTSLASTGWDEATIFEIVQRYCDAQDHARNYRLRAAAKGKLVRAALETLAKASRMTVEEYLEIEESKATSAE
jgi:hypothetical protein